MSILGGAIGAGAIMAVIGHEMSLAREADRLEREIDIGEARARMREQMARERRLEDMRSITKTRLHGMMAQRGVYPIHGGRAAEAVYLNEMARMNRKGGY